MFLCLLKVYLLLWTVSVCSGSQVEARVQSVSPIDGEEETLAMFKLRFVGKERLLNGTLIFLFDKDETYDAVISVFSLKNGEWVQGNIEVRTTPCGALINYIRKFYIPPDADCSVPLTMEDCQLAPQPWEFNFKNVKITTEYWPTFLSRGLIKFTMHFLSKGKSIGGFEMVLAVNDKQN